MNIKFFAAISVLAVSATCGGLQASAAIVTDQVSFTASGFTSVYGGAVPVDPVTGSFRISFDPTMTYTDETAGITLGALNIPLGSALSFDYSPTGNSNGLADELVVGGLQDGAGTIQINPSTDDFYLHIYTFTSSPTFQQLGYTEAAISPSYYYNDPMNGLGSGSVTVTSVIPEPSTWAMMLLGLAGLGFIARRSGPPISQPSRPLQSI